MIHLNFFLALFLAVGTPIVHAQTLGKYIGTVQTEWLGDGRKMRLLAPFSYVDPKGLEWQVPAGWIVDGASIPQFAWSVIGGPFEGKYRNASVIHDFGCDQKARPWESVHEVFYWAMLASNVETWRAKIMYAAVYHFGPRWPRQVTVTGLPKDQTPVAREQALSQAGPGSTAQILSVRPRGRSLHEILTNQPEKADFDIQIVPPPRGLSDDDFENLKHRIEVGETSASGGLSLDDIRAYQPER